jgi:hypothetical protein
VAILNQNAAIFLQKYVYVWLYIYSCLNFYQDDVPDLHDPADDLPNHADGVGLVAAPEGSF